MKYLFVLDRGGSRQMFAAVNWEGRYQQFLMQQQLDAVQLFFLKYHDRNEEPFLDPDPVQ